MEMVEKKAASVKKEVENNEEVKVEKTRNELSLSNVAGIFFILARLSHFFAGIIS